MAKKKQKYYVVWAGREPGVYDSWEACQAQTVGVRGAVYKSFDTREAADEAFFSDASLFIGKAEKPKNAAAPTPTPAAAGKAVEKSDAAQNGEAAKEGEAADERAAVLAPVKVVLPAGVPEEALAVDAACSGNPGRMEYRGVYLRTGQVVFHFGPTYGTNNVGEFLAIVHALALLSQRGLRMPIYSDSRNAMLWVSKRQCRTTLPHNERTAPIYEVVRRAEKWLSEHPNHGFDIRKWDTRAWGEIPADFNRK